MLRVIAVLVPLLLIAAPAAAIPYFVVFSFDPDPIDLANAGAHGSGWFSFQDFLIPEAGPRADIPIFYPESPLAFRWDGIDWTDASAYVYDLAFGINADGRLHGWDLLSGDVFGNQLVPGYSFAFKAGGDMQGWLVYRYSNPTGNYTAAGSWFVTDQEPNPSPGPLADAPEPGGLALIGIGALFAVRTRRDG